MKVAAARLPQSLLGQVLTTNVLVVSLSAVCLTFLFLVSYRKEFRHQQLSRGEAIAEFLARQSELPLLVGNRDDLLRLAETTLQGEDVLFVRLYNQDGARELSLATPALKHSLPQSFLEVRRDIRPPAQNNLLDWDANPAAAVPGKTLGRVEIGLSLDKQEALFRVTVLRSLSLLGVGLALTLALLYLRMRHLLRPLDGLSAFTRRVGSGDLTSRAPIGHVTEIAALATAFNEMLDQLGHTTVSRDYVDSVIRSMGESLIVVSRRGLIQTVNQATLSMLGYTQEELVGRDVTHVLEPGAASPGTCAGAEVHYRAKDGRLIPVLLSAAPLRDKEGSTTGRVWLAQDDTERKRIQAELLAAKERFSLAVAGANDGIWDWNVPASELYLSPRWKSMLGFEDDELSNAPSTWWGRLHPEDHGRVLQEWQAHLAGDAPVFESEHRMLHRDGDYRWMLSRGLAVRNSQGAATRVAGSQTDITQNKASDPLTGLPNRVLFTDRLSAAIERRRRDPAGQFAVLFLDLDRFKMINDSLGHMAGDHLLLGIAQRLRQAVRDGEPVCEAKWEHTVARLSGDEFAILLQNVQRAGEVESLASFLLEQLSFPYLIDGREVFMSMSIGIALGSDEYLHPQEVLRDADTAMYRAKALGKSRYEVFDAEMRAQAISRLEIDTDLRKAVERHEFLLYYQPKVALADGHLEGFEALVRWSHPSRGLVLPSDFIPLAEETGLISSLGERILRDACRQMKQWLDSYPAAAQLKLSVNISVRQFLGVDLVQQVAEVLRDLQLDAATLQLEITESMLMEDAEKAAGVLDSLKVIGVGLKIDDFGTGYSSLNYLHRFPFDTVKIDRSFVSNLEDGDGVEIVKAIVALARSLNMDVVAEGVETARQAQILQQLGCNFGQGYHFARPLPAADAERLLQGDGFISTPVLSPVAPDGAELQQLHWALQQAGETSAPATSSLASQAD